MVMEEAPEQVNHLPCQLGKFSLLQPLLPCQLQHHPHQGQHLLLHRHQAVDFWPGACRLACKLPESCVVLRRCSSWVAACYKTCKIGALQDQGLRLLVKGIYRQEYRGTCKHVKEVKEEAFSGT
ncbi:UNVERIFIED_CONTAM: hypothetical protein FKN15_012298 [Acipenser sinensis]